jgi:hypothetical protein
MQHDLTAEAQRRERGEKREDREKESVVSNGELL